MSAGDNTNDAGRKYSAADQNGPVEYELRVKGHLAPRWASRFPGLSLTNEDEGTSLVRGTVVDQAALHGLLQQLRDMGLPLLSVTPVRAGSSDPSATDHRYPNPRKET
jgi:hypothetical protein